MTEPKIVYLFNQTGEYAGTDLAYPSPLEPGVWLTPPSSTETAPPNVPQNKAAVWQGDEWELVDDFRNRMIYKKSDASKAHLLDIGPVPYGYTVDAPADNLIAPQWDEDEESWVETPYVAPALTWDDIRMRRDGLLNSCDWTQIADAPLTAPEKAQWTAYRAELRNIPQDFDDPEDVEWPTSPA